MISSALTVSCNIADGTAVVRQFELSRRQFREEVQRRLDSHQTKEAQPLGLLKQWDYEWLALIFCIQIMVPS